MKNTTAYIQAEIAAVTAINATTIVTRDCKCAALKELNAALPGEGESSINWAERNGSWFQLHAARVYSAGFFDGLEAVLTADYAERRNG
jgi:hypothetical protein